MKRVLAALASGVCICACSNDPLAAPRPPPTPQLSGYLPLARGSFWSYIAPEAVDAGWVSVRVVEKEQRADMDCFQIETSADSIAGPRTQTGTICMASSGQGLAISVDRLTGYEPPLLILNLPPQIGQKWTWQGQEKWTGSSGPAEESRTKYEFEIEKEEPVQVPAGRFTALKLSIKKDAALAVHYWFARDVGIVKATGPGILFGIHGELKQFSSGAP